MESLFKVRLIPLRRAIVDTAVHQIRFLSCTLKEGMVPVNTPVFMAISPRQAEFR